jgi:hypothetical protein
MERNQRIHQPLARRSRAVVGALSLVFLGSAGAQAQSHFKDLESYVEWVRASHKAPFDRDGSVLPTGGAAQLQAAQARAANLLAAPNTSFVNVKVNRDRDPWPKAEIASAVEPVHGKSYVVMSNDFRENWDHMFYHVSKNGGGSFTDDSMVGGNDPITGFIQLTFQSDPGVSFDRAGHSYLSTITGNEIFDFTNFYLNLDTQIEAAQGFAGGSYTNLVPITIDTQPCFETLSTFSCDATLDKPLITTDAVAGSPNVGTTYIYYTLFCNSPTSGFCTDGTASIPAGTSAILESHSPGPGLAFSAPALVSGALTQTQFSSLVVDSNGTPHMFFDDFSAFPATNMWESTLTPGGWVVSSAPVASFLFNGLGNPNWGFRDAGAAAPGCGIHGTEAYCAFSANQVGSGPLEATPSVYVARVNTGTGSSQVSRVNNDAFGGLKEHFFAWATATPNGDVYVGWYDDRNDPFNTKVEYFVGKSTNGGATFSTQKAVSDVGFNPCVGFPGCGFFGDYTQIVSGPDGVVHAAWSDTRDGASMQIWSQSITW